MGCIHVGKAYNQLDYIYISMRTQAYPMNKGCKQELWFVYVLWEVLLLNLLSDVCMR